MRLGMDRIFITVLRGKTPECARPILATEDKKVVRAVAREVTRCLGISLASLMAESPSKEEQKLEVEAVGSS
jgi:hypothetical protein